MKVKIRFKIEKILYSIAKRIPDQKFLEIRYFLKFRKKLNLKNPQSFTEKIQYYKLFYRDDQMTVAADKYKLRRYLSDKGYDDLLPMLYEVQENFTNVNWEELPQKFVIKLNNGSGTNIIVNDKSIVDYNDLVKEIKKWENVSTIVMGREWAYYNIPRKILIEELLIPEDEFQKVNGLNDYKIMCFNGEPKIIWVDVGRFNTHKRNFYDLNWNKLQISSDVPNFDYDFQEPKFLKKMIQISCDLSSKFPFVRIDFYILNNKLYIGEMTFYPWSGFVKFKPREFDDILGTFLQIDC